MNNTWSNLFANENGVYLSMVPKLVLVNFKKIKLKSKRLFYSEQKLTNPHTDKDNHLTQEAI